MCYCNQCSLCTNLTSHIGLRCVEAAPGGNLNVTPRQGTISWLVSDAPNNAKKRNTVWLKKLFRMKLGQFSLYD